MISNQSIDDFVSICKAIHEQASDACGERIASVMRQASAAGTGISTRTLLAIDSSAAKVLEEFAPRIYGALHDLNAAEPVSDPEERRRLLRNVLEQELRTLGRRVQGLRDAKFRHLRQGLRSNVNPRECEVTVERAVKEYVGRIGLAVKQQHTNKVTRDPTVVHQPVFHGSVGNYQVGNHNTATVNQTVLAHLSSEDVIGALDSLIRALQDAHNVPTAQRAEVVEVLEQVKVEAEKETPNKTMLGGLIGSVRDVLEGLQAAPGAWETLKNWYEHITTAASLGG
jgi:hypothetical protein